MYSVRHILGTQTGYTFNFRYKDFISPDHMWLSFSHTHTHYSWTVSSHKCYNSKCFFFLEWTWKIDKSVYWTCDLQITVPVFYQLSYLALGLLLVSQFVSISLLKGTSQVINQKWKLLFYHLIQTKTTLKGIILLSN